MANLILEAQNANRVNHQQQNLNNQNNQTINQTNQVNAQVQRYANMASMMMKSPNPKAFIANLASQNPDVANVLNIINNGGMSPKDAYYAAAKAMGVNPDYIPSLLKTNMHI